ncbi:DNA polymerase I [Candidatus Uhrbacteria bacterium]|nr:DNA polymerase I [Candidatus Uhrbacteria bacterium]
MSTKPTFLLLDGNALLHRAWHAIPPLTTKDGLVVNAAYGFAMVVEKMLAVYKPDFMAVAWDLPGETFRHKLYKEYKAQREKKEQELYDQIPIIQNILSAFHIPSVSVENYEADDVIGTLAREAREKHVQTMIVTGDLDSLQLVDNDTQVLFFQKGISETKLYDEAAVVERYGLTPSQLIDYKALRGDPSDNLPGIAGIGEKTATDLLQRYQSIEGIFGALADVEEKVAKKLRGQERQVETSKVLVSIVTDVKTGFDFDASKRRDPDLKKLLSLYRDLEFRTLLKKYTEGSLGVAPVVRTAGNDKKHGTIRVVRSLYNHEKTFGPGSTVGVLVAEQAPDLFGATVAAAALSDGMQTIVVMNPSKEALAYIQNRLTKASLIVTHDLKHLMHQLGEPITTPAFDTMIASYLLHSGSRVHDLTSAAYKTLGRTFSEVPTAFAKEKDYETLGSIVVALPLLATKMRHAMEKVRLTRVFDDIEMPLIPVLYKMERAGIELNSESLATFSVSLKKRIDELTGVIHKAAGTDFNINSPSQLAEVLFETMKLPTKGIKKTKSGFSTAAPELEKLWDMHKIIPLLSEYRELTKLQSTYVEALPKLVAKDGRVHTSYNQTVAATGRLSSSDPNLQNIPIKTELGRSIRKAFVAPTGSRLIAADYSQIELRLVAVIAKDKPFIQAFQEGADIHSRTAAEVFEVAQEKVTKEQRRAAKAINFGIIYGMGPRSLSRSTGLTMTQAKDFIDRYFQIHHAVRDYLDNTKILAHTQGYVETLFGRRRYFPEIQSGVPMLVAAAERMAINMPVQGTAADIMKMAMLRVDGWLFKSRWPAKMLLQVHDELVLEVEKDAIEAVSRGVREMMEGVASFEVPLVVDIEVGKNWGEMEAL